VNPAGKLIDRVEEAAEEVVSGVTEKAKQEAAAYRGTEPRPLGPLLGIIGLYCSLAGSAALVAIRQKRWPQRIGAGDLALGAVAVYRVANLVSKDTVAAPLRAPFTEFEGPAGEGKLKESVRGSGWRKAIGELVTCPFCLGHWFATFWAIGMVFAPRPTRTAASLFAAAAGADWLTRLDGKLRD
jgi:hypothetical protein